MMLPAVLMCVGGGSQPEGSATPPAEVVVSLGQPFELGLSMTVTVSETGTRLTFIDVAEDSRCRGAGELHLGWARGSRGEGGHARCRHGDADTGHVLCPGRGAARPGGAEHRAAGRLARPATTGSGDSILRLSRRAGGH